MENKPFKYLLFSGVDYEPAGGAGDFLKAFQTTYEALAYEIPEGDDWALITEFDSSTGELKERFYRYDIRTRKDTGWKKTDEEEKE